MTGLVHETAVLEGRWASDNRGLDIILNGVSLSFDTGTNGFGTWSEGAEGFSITSGFASGLNTLDFVVRNALGNPPGPTATGLRVEFTNNSATAVPLPPALPLMLGGLAALWVVRRRADRHAG